MLCYVNIILLDVLYVRTYRYVMTLTRLMDLLQSELLMDLVDSWSVLSLVELYINV